MHFKKQIILLTALLIFLGADAQHFPAKFSEDFQPAFLKGAGVRAIQVESQLSWHPDSTRKMFVGFEHLNFSRRPYAQFSFNDQGFLVQEIDYWDSTHTTYYPDDGESWTEKNVIRWEYEYGKEGKLRRKMKITPYLGKEDTAVTKFERKQDKFGRTIEIQEIGEGLKKREIRKYDQMSRVIFREVWMEIHGEEEFVFRDSLEYHPGETADFKNTVRTFSTGRKVWINDKKDSFNDNREIRRTTFNPDGSQAAVTSERWIFENGRLSEVELPVENGVNFCGISAKNARMVLEYDSNGLLSKRIYFFGPWINTFYYSYPHQP